MEAREFALRVINQVDEHGAYANIALDRELNRQNIGDQDRRFATELVYGVVKSGLTLDWLLGHYISRPLAKIDRPIRNILRMGLYQLFFLDKIPPSAACNEAVKLAKKFGHAGSAKFVNAVLRGAVRQPDKARYPDAADNPCRYISLKYFHPEWIVKRWLERLGPEATEALCQINNQTPPLSLRVNTLKTTRESTLEYLEKEGAVCEASRLVPEGILCTCHPALGHWPPLADGFVQVQDESSMMASHVLDPQPGEFIIDACGAPGGKSTHIATLMNNRGRVLSTDLYAHKLDLTAANAARLGISIIETLELDAATLHTRYESQADRMLVDAPCSGLGVLRRKPDARWRKSEQILADLPALQASILRSAAACVKVGGILVYSTCTTEREENQDIVRDFLQGHSGYSLQTAGHWLPVKRNEEMVQLWPHVDGTDGFFISGMVRDK